MWSLQNSIFTCERNHEGENIIHYLCRNGGVIDLLTFRNAINDENKYLLSEFNRDGKQCMHIVVSLDKVDPINKLTLLMKWGADINSKDRKDGNTALHIAVLTNNYEVAKWLCQQPGVDKEILNFAHKTPYQVACDRANIRMMDLLRKNGARCDVPLKKSAAYRRASHGHGVKFIRMQESAH
ncbi:NF-kappa-B inhibitor cactus-like [Microplitis mediator]|uniref:NF-kappa-B inhibitor cactus-like n=1 Tax=Microplitis mediator TaxID=375433 RepID=UPI0025559E10|nr:NF-kappa-B inhibitor cactus-like [Microplitis mediator]